jgi:hypothetical protein
MKVKTDNYEIYKGDCLDVMKDIKKTNFEGECLWW